MLMDLFKSRSSRILLSIAIGLLLAFLYFRVSSGGRCVVFNEERRDEEVPVVPPVREAGSCYRFDKYNSPCNFPVHTAAYIPGGTFQDPGYGSGSGSIGAVYEGFNVECLGLNKPIQCNNMMPYQVACQPQEVFNLPRDARMDHQPMYPCGIPGQLDAPKCQRRHPMDSVYAPPNEGFLM